MLEQLPEGATLLDRHQASARVRRFADLLAQWTHPVDASSLQIEVQALRIGELALVATPGEPVAEIGVEVKTASPFLFAMFCGSSAGLGGAHAAGAPEC